jgi:hypothetical protein
MKGFEMYRSRTSGANHSAARLPLCGCLLRLPKTEMTVVATIQDYGGDMRGRPFPICFFVAFPTMVLPGPTSGSVRETTRVVMELMALRRQIPRFLNSPGRFDECFGDRFLDLERIDAERNDSAWLREARQLPMEQWFSRVKDGLKFDQPEAWMQSVHKWGENIRMLESETFEPTFRFPLSPAAPLDVQLAGWLHWLNARMDLQKRTLSLLVSGDLDKAMGHLTVIARDPEAEDLILFTPVANTVNSLDDLSQMEPPAGDGQVIETAENKPVSAQTWWDFVDGRAGSP